MSEHIAAAGCAEELAGFVAARCEAVGLDQEQARTREVLLKGDLLGDTTRPIVRPERRA